MTTNQDERSEGESTWNFLPVDRRRVLYGIGTGAMLAGLGTGVSAAEGDDDGAEPMPDVSGDGVHPVFGFSALSPEIEPPVEPDHEVQALIRPREDRGIPEFFFEPTGLAIEPGETVQFTLTTPHHSVTSFHPAMGITQRVPDDVPPFSSPVLPVQSYWLYTFEEAGVYDYHCGPHEVFGHVGRIVAGEALGPGAEPVAPPEEPFEEDEAEEPIEEEAEEDEATEEEPNEDEPEEPPGEGPSLRPPLPTAAAVLDDPALEPDQIIQEGMVSWEDLQPESKEVEL